MAGHPIYRMKANGTDPELLALAIAVPLFPQKNRAVFYAEDEGARLAKQFVQANIGYTRLDEMLEITPQGKKLLSKLKSPG